MQPEALTASLSGGVTNLNAMHWQCRRELLIVSLTMLSLWASESRTPSDPLRLLLLLAVPQLYDASGGSPSQAPR